MNVGDRIVWAGQGTPCEGVVLNTDSLPVIWVLWDGYDKATDAHIDDLQPNS